MSGKESNEPMECPACGEIELRPAGDMFECSACHHEEQHV